MRVPERRVNSEVKGVRVNFTEAEDRGTGGEVELHVVIIVKRGVVTADKGANPRMPVTIWWNAGLIAELAVMVASAAMNCDLASESVGLNPPGIKPLNQIVSTRFPLVA